MSTLIRPAQTQARYVVWGDQLVTRPDGDSRDPIRVVGTVIDVKPDPGKEGHVFFSIRRPSGHVTPSKSLDLNAWVWVRLPEGTA